MLATLALVPMLLATALLLPQASAQTPIRDRDQVIADKNKVREALRTEAQAKAAATCGTRGYYEGDLLILQFDRRVEVFRDTIEFDEQKGLMETAGHFLESCNDKLGISVVQLFRLGQGYVADNTPWVNIWAETVLVHSNRWGRLRLRWLGTPIASPDENAIASCEFGAMADAYHGIHIAVRDERRGWRKLWHHLPNDMLNCKFLRWEGPNRFRVLMHDQVLGGGNHWESVIEFTPTSLTRADGPKTPGKPSP